MLLPQLYINSFNVHHSPTRRLLRLREVAVASSKYLYLLVWCPWGFPCYTDPPSCELGLPCLILTGDLAFWRTCFCSSALAPHAQGGGICPSTTGNRHRDSSRTLRSWTTQACPFLSALLGQGEGWHDSGGDGGLWGHWPNSWRHNSCVCYTTGSLKEANHFCSVIMVSKKFTGQILPGAGSRRWLELTLSLNDSERWVQSNWSGGWKWEAKRIHRREKRQAEKEGSV